MLAYGTSSSYREKQAQRRKGTCLGLSACSHGMFRELECRFGVAQVLFLAHQLVSSICFLLSWQFPLEFPTFPSNSSSNIQRNKGLGLWQCQMERRLQAEGAQTSALFPAASTKNTSNKQTRFKYKPQICHTQLQNRSPGSLCPCSSRKKSQARGWLKGQQNEGEKLGQGNPCGWGYRRQKKDEGKTPRSNEAARREQRVSILHPDWACMLVCLKKLSLSFLSWKEYMLTAEGKKKEKERKRKLGLPWYCCSTFLSFYLCVYVTKRHFQKELTAEDTTCFRTQEKKVNDVTFPLSLPYTFFFAKL